MNMNTIKATAMSDSRRRKIEGLRERERLREYRTRLQSMLNQKLLTKYGDIKTRGSRKNDAIKKTVAAFMKQTGPITDQHLVQLEQQVKQVVADLANPQTSARPASSGSGMPSGNGMVGKLRAQTAGVKKDYNEWTILDAYNAIEAEEGAQATYKKAKSKQREFKTLLDKQVQECSGKGSNEKDEEKQYVAKQNYLLEEWKTGQQKVQMTIRGKLEEEKRAREGQISERQQRKKTELAARRAAEIQELDIVRQEIQRQEQMAIDKKIKEKERLKGIRLENEKERLVRKKRAEEEAAEDQRLMEEYKRKLEQEEVDRANAFKRRLDKLEATGSKWAEEGAGKEQMDVEKRLEAMVLREAAKKDAADEERERRDKAALKYNAKLMAETNKSLMESKVRAGTAQQAEEMKYAQQFRTAGEDYQREEINRKIAKRKAMQAHQAQLMEQIARKKAVDKFAMSDSERKINAALLNKLTNDPVFMEKLDQKLRAPSRQNRARSSGGLGIGSMG